MNRTLTLGLAAISAGALVLVGLPVLAAMMLLGGASDQRARCSTGQNSVVLTGGTAKHELSEEQLANASVIISEGRRLAMADKGIVIALAVASQESRFLNYANDGQGDDLKPDQHGIAKSLELPHEAVGSDHGSLGVFQQQWPWWGSMVELMDPATAARKFYAALLQVEGWESMAVTVAGQAVQKSAYPEAYADDVALAVELLGSTSGSWVEQSAYFGSASTCSVAMTGEVVMPLVEGSSYVDQASFGAAGSRWESTHTGTDFSAGCGTAVVASTDGEVNIRMDQSWAGTWLVEVDSGSGGVVTWYAHMQQVAVTSGDQVLAGQPLGEVGAQGNATGCHLHFEVRPGGGQPVDPTRWLAENVGGVHEVIPAGGTPQQTAAALITSNVAFWLKDRVAERHIHRLLAERPDVLLLQEVANRNVTAIVDRAPGTWSVWQPAGAKGGSAIVWNAARFSAAARGAELGFEGAEYDRWMPWVLLESDTGRLPVVALHLPTRASSDAVMRRHFRTMTDNYVALISEMNESGYPPVAGGDWNHPLDVPRERWSPVPVLQKLGMTTNWRGGQPCQESVSGGRIDGFALNPGYLQTLDQGCLAYGASDHRPVWVVVAPVQ